VRQAAGTAPGPLIARMGDKLPKEMTANKVAATAEFWR
jgi:hypothetical protein